MTALTIRASIVLILAALLLAACNPGPPTRPREGAPAIVDGRSVRPGGASTARPGVPPTLARPVAPPTPGASDQQPQADAQPGTPTPSANAVIVATDGAGANLRTGPSMRAPIVTTLAEGTPVDAFEDTVSAEGRPWRKIRSGDREGWVVAVVVRPR